MKANVESKNSNQTSTMKKIITNHYTERIIRTSSTSMPKIKKTTHTNIELYFLRFAEDTFKYLKDKFLN